MGYLLHLMFRCDGVVMERDVFVEVFGGTKHTQERKGAFLGDGRKIARETRDLFHSLPFHSTGQFKPVTQYRQTTEQ